MFDATIDLGPCEQCGRQQRLPAFVTGDPPAICGCPTSDLPAELRESFDAVDRGGEFDRLVVQMQLALAALPPHTLDKLACMLSADVGNAQTALMNGDRRAALAFLVRVGAMSRFLAVDHPELCGEIDRIRRRK